MDCYKSLEVEDVNYCVVDLLSMHMCEGIKMCRDRRRQEGCHAPVTGSLLTTDVSTGDVRPELPI